MVTYRQNSHRAPSVGFPPCSDSGLRYKPSQTPVWKRSFGFSQSLGGGGRTPGEAQSPPRFCKVPVGIFLTPAFLRCCRSDKAVEKERQCPLNPAQLDLLSHSVLMPGKNVLTQQLSKHCRDNRARTLRARPLISRQPRTGNGDRRDSRRDSRTSTLQERLYWDTPCALLPGSIAPRCRVLRGVRSPFAIILWERRIWPCTRCCCSCTSLGSLSPWAESQ